MKGLISGYATFIMARKVTLTWRKKQGGEKQDTSVSKGFICQSKWGPLGAQIPQTRTMPQRVCLSSWLNSWWNWTWPNLTTQPESWTTSLISSSSNVGSHSLLRGALWQHKFWTFQCQQQQRQLLKEGRMEGGRDDHQSRNQQVHENLQKKVSVSINRLSQFHHSKLSSSYQEETCIAQQNHIEAHLTCTLKPLSLPLSLMPFFPAFQLMGRIQSTLWHSNSRTIWRLFLPHWTPLIKTWTRNRKNMKSQPDHSAGHREKRLISVTLQYSCEERWHFWRKRKEPETRRRGTAMASKCSSKMHRKASK